MGNDHFAGRSRPCVRRRGGLVPLLVVLAAASFAVRQSQAAQITFAFDAIVTEVNRPPNTRFELPFAVKPGDSINGILQFEPILFGQNGIVTKLQLNLASESFSAASIPLLTFNDYFTPSAFSIDSISAACSPATLCATVESSVSGLAIDQISLGFGSGRIWAFNIGESLADAAFWNRFEFWPPGGTFGYDATRRFTVELSSALQPSLGTVSIVGDVGPVRAIPEPPCIVAAIAVIFLGKQGRIVRD